MNMEAPQDPLGEAFEKAIDAIKMLLPEREPSVLLDGEYFKLESFSCSYTMLLRIRPGAQIMVRTRSGYQHHGIYVGGLRGKDEEPHVVVLTPSTNGSATLAVRSYSDFVSGGVAWAEAKYLPGCAVDQSLSAILALAMVSHFRDARVIHKEHFATVCRCLLYERHDAIDSQFRLVPDAPPRRANGCFKPALF
jgi:hypothetical protein